MNTTTNTARDRLIVEAMEASQNLTVLESIPETLETLFAERNLPQIEEAILAHAAAIEAIRKLGTALYAVEARWQITGPTLWDGD